MPFDLLLARRGRGLANLLEGLGEGDPVAWIIVVGVVAIFAGPPLYRMLKSDGGEAGGATEPSDDRQKIGRDAPGEGDGDEP